MLGLQLPTDPRWVKNVVEKNIEEILTDHAYCEQKAASNAISLMVRYPEHMDMARQMAELAREELEHYEMVLEKIRERGLTLGWERKDPYVHDLMKFIEKSGKREVVLVDRLLFAAMIEARSCERFKVLYEHIDDKDLSQFYYELMVSEANHYTLFIKLAKKHGKNIDVDKRWKEFLAYEATVIKSYGKKETVHG